jgi:hypothetical protein
MEKCDKRFLIIKRRGRMNTALKEWSAVIAALDRGLQIFLLRKGGIVEASGFQPKYREFLLFPTFEHQHARSLKPEYLDLLAPQPDGHIRITHMARVTDVLHAPSAAAGMRDIAECHVWNDEFIRQRYEYQPDLPLYMLWCAHTDSDSRNSFHSGRRTPVANHGCT